MEPKPNEPHLVQVETDRDHEGLAMLLEKVSLICGHPEEERECKDCPQERLQHCGSEMHAHTERLMLLLLDHFHREEALMDALPKSRDARVHCARHRAQHVAFSTRYNSIVANLDTGSIFAGIRRLEPLVVEWIREHVLKFDAELTSMLEAAAQKDLTRSAPLLATTGGSIAGRQISSG